MASYPVSAIVLKKTKLGETDVILTLLSSDGSQIRAVAKGARGPKSRFGGRTEPFTHVDCLMHTGKSLEIISEVRTVKSYALLRDEYTHLLGASVIADILDKISLEGQVDPRLFAMTCSTFDAMAKAEPEHVEAVLLAFLLKALAMQGYRPTLDVCAVCFDPIVDVDSGQVARWSSNTGGVVCPTCAQGLGDVRLFPNAAIGWLGVLFGSTMDEISLIELPKSALDHLFSMVDSFTQAHLPARIKAMDFYRSQRA